MYQEEFFNKGKKILCIKICATHGGVFLKAAAPSFNVSTLMFLLYPYILFLYSHILQI